MFLLLLLLIFLSCRTSPQTHISTEQILNSPYDQPVFEDITIADGLPENSGENILQDYLGYLWISTQNGLVRYDGYSMKVYILKKDTINSLSTMDLVIYEDKRKTLWIGTLAGLNKFDRASETFKIYGYNSRDPNTINNDQVRCLYEDKSGKFWIGTQEGLNLFDRDKEIFIRYNFRIPDNLPISARNNFCINAMTEDPATGDLLIGTELNGLWRFDQKEKRFSKYSADILDKKIGCVQAFCKARDGKIWMASTHTLASLDPAIKSFKFYIDFPTEGDEQNIKFTNPIGSVIEDRDGLIWSGFFKGEKGIFCLNPENENLQQYNLFPDKPRQARYNKILSLYEDRSGIIWVGTWLSGIKKLDKLKNQFKVLRSDPGYLNNSLSHPLVYSVVYDPDGYIWFCTQKALDKYDIKNGTYKHYLKDEKCITSAAYVGFRDKSGYIWLGTAACGLIRFDPGNESYRFYFNNPDNPVNLVNKQIKKIIQDSRGMLWIGTDGFGLYKFDIKNNQTIIYKNDPDDPSSLRNNQVLDILEDSFGTLWVGTNLGGLNKFDRVTGKFTNCGFDCISALYEDKHGNFWVGDYYSELSLYDRENNIITAHYTKKEGLAHQHIIGIMEDDHDNLWFATRIGLSKFNLSKKTFRNYTKEDGFPQWLTIESFCFKDPDGNMYINTSEGQIVFHPDSIKDNLYPPQVVLDGVSLFNRPGEKLNYHGFISELRELTLPYYQNDLRFDFVGLHFSAPGKNSYKYILENFDDDWTDAGNQRYATYTNLDPGTYVFRVKASNKDGIWNEKGASLTLIITPPWWKTIWAYLFYLMVIAGVLYVTWKAQFRRIRIKNEFRMSRFEAQKLHEVDELKSRFFTNISHEFRTPLTLILGPAKQLLERTKDADTAENLKMIHRNAKNLNKLVDELLDISKIEAGEMKLNTRPMNIISVVKDIVFPFYSFAERKKITLNLKYDEFEIIGFLDKEKAEKILNNILSNAFKFTPEGGKIELGVRRTDKTAEIIISDSGIGIPPDQIDKIFDRFYQVDGSHTREHEGTGIGLSLTKELVDLHKGKIEVESKEGKGTTFTVKFPLGREHLNPEEIIESDLVYEEQRTEREYGEKEVVKAAEETSSSDRGNLPLLLIIEDNADVRFYIKDNLKKEYRVAEAGDGEEGWNKSIEQIPDLIISDVMMPKMDGFKMCEKLKNDERTSHIPVILLTAKAARENKLEGYEMGADDYIMKPFEPEELRARIKNLIEQRKRLHEHFQKSGLFELPLTKINPVDKKFMEKVYETIINHISDSSLNLDTFAGHMNISKSLLHKKIVSLVGEPPGEFIRRVRLTKAADLIKNKFGNLSEIALEVGFNNPAYFSECFKKQFRAAPSQYLKGKLKR